MSILFDTALAATAGTAQPPAPGMNSIVLLVGFVIICYFMMWRPQAKRAKEHKELMSSLSKGSEVVTTGGLMGKVTEVVDDVVFLSLAEGFEIKLQKSSVATLLPKGTLAEIKAKK